MRDTMKVCCGPDEPSACRWKVQPLGDVDDQEGRLRKKRTHPQRAVERLVKCVHGSDGLAALVYSLSTARGAPSCCAIEQLQRLRQQTSDTSSHLQHLDDGF